ncbi:hypothetical protein Mycch_0798 [Mycolicibacterium chubuense NBB4]|uniref:ESX-1 secretion-associated protein EspA/EspE-like domain-containing protein n=1 Tax=Mycolicibacterium chubuense (strain NBB4) TaxID=710421 RepID=I4BEA7_MYCCN|nr:EspA/EspE family type VII secretion system effector [Mycolicibacterium chubuense]AFM15614.1 hypothetical protein Mycch_0798 [Mycolicibacterium chubuense NBB4]
MSVLDAFLATWRDARATFGTGVPQGGERFDRSATLDRLRSDLDAAAPGQRWAGGAATQYAGVNSTHQRVIQDLGRLDRRLARQIDRSAEIVVSGRRDLEAVRTWVLDAAASVPKNAAGDRLLLPIVSRGLRQVSGVLTRANGELTTVGVNIQAISSEYQALGAGQKNGRGPGDGVHAVDYKQSPPPPPYPINEVIAEATDLDGNHVVLRRGYYNESTQQGFGWDKAYWRHHVVNPNVFTDLISHSRPISSKDGTLVYEVPINRVHCSSGFLGMPDCEDTGESVTMRIVANINEGRPGIPDGGQKGVISMYPLAGGSGVVEVKPGWTLTPPWVNNNVPIN